MLSDDILDKYQMTVGIECHVQLATKTKLFSGADNDERDKSPNEVISPIDFGLPGMLPVLNRGAVDLAIRAGKALNAEVARISRFDRKHYFYPDLPKGYQTTQMYQPIIGAGWVEAPLLENGGSVRVRIHHAHLEEDAGKLTHYSGYSLVDLNRAGTPLIEIVSEPDIHSAAEAKAYVTELYHLMTYAGVTRGDLFHGNMRFDVNVSIAPKGASELGTRSEVKNLNSFRSVERAVEFEFRRQVGMLEKGDKVVQETRGWDENTQKTASQRSKENAQDYRYMPDADIPPIVLSDEEIAAIQDEMPRLPGEWRQELSELGLSSSHIETLIVAENEFRGRVEILSLIQKSAQDPEQAKFIANWCVNNLIPLLQGEEVNYFDVDFYRLIVGIYELLASNKLSSTNAKALFKEMAAKGQVEDVESFANDQGYVQVSDTDEIEAAVEAVLGDISSQKAVTDFKSGNERVIGFLVGQVMQKTGGKANPSIVQEIIKSKLS